MARETFVRFLIAASTTIAMSCGNSSGPTATAQSPSPPRAAEIGPLVLSDKGCAYAGPGQIGSGPVALKMTNETQAQFNLDLWRLNAGHTYAEEHDRQFRDLHTAESWFTSIFMEPGPEADARRAKALPQVAMDQTRIPDIFFSGPGSAPVDEAARRRFFGEE